ncbi:hypothetical protein E3J61_03070 [Candidatus Dependentiae bacterium]|nr:MAG: hypothetical protein E3J61_03070 [Candidatus Dependentiae bacterium]
MIKRLVLYSIFFCCTSSLLGTKQESVPPSQVIAKKERAFFETKKGKAVLAFSIVLLGGSAVWYLRGMRGRTNSGLSQEDMAKPSLPLKALTVWQKRFGVRVSVRVVKTEKSQFLILTPTKEGMPEGFLTWYSEEKRNSYLKTLAAELPKTWSTKNTFIFRYRQGSKFFELDRAPFPTG